MAVTIAAGVTSGFVAAAARHHTVVAWMGGWSMRKAQTVGIALVADPLSAGLTALTAGLMFCGVLFSRRGLDQGGAWSTR